MHIFGLIEHDKKSFINCQAPDPQAEAPSCLTKRRRWCCEEYHLLHHLNVSFEVYHIVYHFDDRHLYRHHDPP